jgi:hypothetical protein
MNGNRGIGGYALRRPLGRAALADGTDDAVGVLVSVVEEFDGLGESHQDARLAEEARRRR